MLVKRMGGETKLAWQVERVQHCRSVEANGAGSHLRLYEEQGWPPFRTRAADLSEAWAREPGTPRKSNGEEARKNGERSRLVDV